MPLAALFVGVATVASRAFAAEPPPVSSVRAPSQWTSAEDYWTPRDEPAGFPIIGGDSDVGFEIGVAGTLSRFADGVAPYRWNMDAIAAASFKGVPGGFEVAQQSYLWGIDAPGLAGGRLRFMPVAEFRRTVNQGYFGLGNASAAARPAGTNHRYFEYVHLEGGVRAPLRYRIATGLFFVSAPIARFVDPSPYPDSKLATDATARAPNGSPYVLGVTPLAIVSEAVGLLYDSRDSEIFTRDGWFTQVGTRVSQGLPFDASVLYGEAEITAARYTPVGGPFVLAVQGAVDAKFGHVPFYELFTGGVFQPDYMIGGSASVRGVPFGRYLGQTKVVGNAELRAMLFRIHFLGQTFQLGNVVFADTGRVWIDYTFRSPLDGGGVGLKWGAGVGEYLLWGQAAMFRVDIAYSPDAMAENPGFPFGVYVEDGLTF